jgi:nucleoid-associated protein EbfC
MADDETQAPDLGGLLDSFQRVQAAREAEYEGTAGGGAVVVRASGDLQFKAVTISPEVVDAADVEMLQDLVLAALHDLAAVMAAAQKDAMGALGGLDLGGLIPGAAPPGET